LNKELIAESGQSFWLDYIDRELIDSGTLKKYIDDFGLKGLTSNPSIFLHAITKTNYYSKELSKLQEKNISDPYLGFIDIAIQDIKDAASLFMSVYKTTNKKDGYVSIELPPSIANDVEASIDEAINIYKKIDMPNIMIKVPATQSGLKIFSELIIAGINVNITLLFDCDIYLQFASTYIDALEKRINKNEAIDHVASVASFFVSRIDTATDQTHDNLNLKGKIAIANAIKAYKGFQELFSGNKWEMLASKGAMPQRPLWASTSTKNPDYSDILYVQKLFASQTVNTLPEKTMLAFFDHGENPININNQTILDALSTLEKLEKEGIALQEITAQLLKDGLTAFENDFNSLMESIEKYTN
jgi:transaldolase